jgi:hypothetical protein
VAGQRGRGTEETSEKERKKKRGGKEEAGGGVRKRACACAAFSSNGIFKDFPFRGAGFSLRTRYIALNGRVVDESLAFIAR